MQSAAGRMRTLIDDLLTYSRVSTKARPFTPVDLNSVVGDVLDDLGTQMERTGGRVEVDALPTVHGDAGQFRQLVQNIVGNALKFHKPGVPPVVRIRAMRWEAVRESEPRLPAGEGYRVTFSDNGIGFDQAYSDRIFEVFQRLHGRDEYEGTGIGLAICRKIAERHGGTISVSSREGEGTTFFVDPPTAPETIGN